MRTINTSDSAGLWIEHDKMFDFLKACARDVFTLSACIQMPLSGAVTQFIHTSAQFISYMNISVNSGILLTQYYFIHVSKKFTDKSTTYYFEIYGDFLLNGSKLIRKNFSDTGATGGGIYLANLKKLEEIYSNMMRLIPGHHDNP